MGYLEKMSNSSQESEQINANVNVHVYCPDIPVSSEDCTIYPPGIGTLFYSRISLGENLAHLL